MNFNDYDKMACMSFFISSISLMYYTWTDINFAAALGNISGVCGLIAVGFSMSIRSK